MPAEPKEIIIQPAEVWIAALATAFPGIDVAPGGGWTKLAALEDITEDGVICTHDYAFYSVRGANSLVQKSAITEQGLTVAFEMLNMSMLKWAQMLGGLSIVDTAAGGGLPGHQAIQGFRGVVPNTIALLVRLVSGSPELLGGNLQLEVPAVNQMATASPISFAKGQEARLAFEFQAIENPNAAGDSDRFFIWRAKDAIAV